jgi:SAM-dependent methyltransferase
MSTDWEENAEAWIDHVGTRGDFSREFILDPVLLQRVRLGGDAGAFKYALDAGCGEGRFCRFLAKENIHVIGIDPTQALIEEARKRDPRGDYRLGVAEALPFAANSFDLVVSYLTLIDIEEFRSAIAEMARVLAPGGRLLVANVASFFSAGPTEGAQFNETPSKGGFAVDKYFEERNQEVQIGKFRVRNWHRPFQSYMECFLANGLTLTFFAEPRPLGGDPKLQEAFGRVPPFVVLEWKK